MKKLFISKTDKKLAGVCGGFAEALDVDSTLVRIVVVFLTLVTGIFPVVVLYIIAAVLMPDAPKDTIHDVPPTPGAGSNTTV